MNVMYRNKFMYLYAHNAAENIRYSPISSLLFAFKTNTHIYTETETSHIENDVYCVCVCLRNIEQKVDAHRTHTTNERINVGFAAPFIG